MTAPPDPAARLRASIDAARTSTTVEARTLEEALDSLDEIELLLPAGCGLTAPDFRAAVVSCVLADPTLIAADPDTLHGALMLCAELGLLPGTKGGCLLTVDDRLRVVWVLTYRGHVQLRLRHGSIIDIEVHEVRHGDELSLTYAAGEKAKELPDVIVGVAHTPALNPDGNDDVIGAWAAFQLADGHTRVEHLTSAELAASKAYSEDQATRRHEPVDPWLDDTGRARAGVLRKAEPFLPTSPALARALAADRGVAVWDPDRQVLALTPAGSTFPAGTDPISEPAPAKKAATKKATSPGAGS